MSDHTLGLRRFLRVVWWHKVAVDLFAVLGLAAGALLTALSPAVLTSTALVVLPSSVHNAGTQVTIATSDPVLARALHALDFGESAGTLRGIQVKSLTPDILSVSGLGETAAQAERTADAVAMSYVAYVNSATRPGGPVRARILQPALNATGTLLPPRLLVTGGLGALFGLLIGVFTVLAFSRRDHGGRIW
jgi:uncharacterized protein involved in exopolysaccharide biosynthesis